MYRKTVWVVAALWLTSWTAGQAAEGKGKKVGGKTVVAEKGVDAHRKAKMLHLKRVAKAKGAGLKPGPAEAGLMKAMAELAKFYKAQGQSDKAAEMLQHLVELQKRLTVLRALSGHDAAGEAANALLRLLGDRPDPREHRLRQVRERIDGLKAERLNLRREKAKIEGT